MHRGSTPEPPGRRADAVTMLVVAAMVIEAVAAAAAEAAAEAEATMATAAAPRIG